MENTHPTVRRHEETLEDVAARLRAEYAKHTPAQRERLGDEPSDGTIAGEWIRARCNDETDEERDAAFDRAMAIIYGEAAKSHAKQPILS
jgi:hypothetical protein